MIWFIFVFFNLLPVTTGNSIMFPNERTALDDCRLRYYRVDTLTPIRPTIGLPARFREFPHMAAIGWTRPNDTILWGCGGSLIWDNFVFTAAHCAYKTGINAPDVVRLGDNDLYSSKDDEWVQEFRIAKIIKHPKHSYFRRYHDVALLKLDRSVKMTREGSVVPACLWKDKEMRFKKLVATGWGSEGFALKGTSNLVKAILKPVSNENCSLFYPSTRFLNKGLTAEHLCARDKKMDTCDGDSGGPLQVKLMHNSRMSPFIVGVTSFGVPCGTSIPGVYTRVSKYHKWIINTMRKNGALDLKADYNETSCALRYYIHREYEPHYYTWKRARIVNEESPMSLVSIRWKKKGPNCKGVIVDEDTVLTVAECTDFKGKSPRYITSSDIAYPISKIVVHPRYVRGLAYNNIAILKLRKLVRENYHFMPSCISTLIDKYVLEAYGKGRKDMNIIYNSKSIDSHLVDLRVISNFKHSNDCVISERFMPFMRNGLANEHLCLGGDDFLVPGLCEIIPGTTVGISRGFYYTTHALALFSRDCGFGEHMIVTRLDSHVEWLNSVLLPNYRNSSAKYYLNRDLQVGDRCTQSSGLSGQCVPVDVCTNHLEHTQGQVTFCSNETVVCCSNPSQIHPNILNCSRLVENIAQKTPDGSLANTFGNRTGFVCRGSIINELFIITTASCLKKAPPKFVLLYKSNIVVDIDSILFHPDFKAANRTNDIALIRLKIPLSWNASVYPICLWTNKTVTPMHLDINYFTSNRGENVHQYNVKYHRPKSKKLHPMYNSDCQKAHRYLIPDSQLCIRDPYLRVYVSASDQLIWKNEETNVDYLVGLATKSYRFVFTRISAFTEWISQHAFYGEK